MLIPLQRPGRWWEKPGHDCRDKHLQQNDVLHLKQHMMEQPKVFSMGTEHFGQFLKLPPNSSISQADPKCQSLRHWEQNSLVHLGQLPRVEPLAIWQTVPQSGAGHHAWFLSKTTFRASKSALCFSKWSWLARGLMSTNMRTFLQASDGHLILTVFRDISDSIHVFRHCNSKQKGEDFQSITFFELLLTVLQKEVPQCLIFSISSSS